VGDTIGRLSALCVTAADERDQSQISELARRAQAETGKTVKIAYIDQGYTGEDSSDLCGADLVIRPEVVKRPTAMKRLWAVATSIGNRTKLRLDCASSPGGV
jgi:hypothetical protein